MKSLLEMGFKGLNNCIVNGRENSHCASGLRKKKKKAYKSVEAKMLGWYHPQCNTYKVPETWDSR